MDRFQVGERVGVPRLGHPCGNCPYRLLWDERSIRPVANLTLRDGEELLEIAPKVSVRAVVRTFPLEEAKEARARLRSGRIEGAAVLEMPETS